jgi:putative Holliday junction resolvase
MGRILALDFGLKRVGAAISDATRSFASPLEFYTRRNERLDAVYFRNLVTEERVEIIVVGLPVHASSHESDMSAKARTWGRWLEGVCQMRVIFFDERYTSNEAERRLLEAGLRGKALKSRRDMLAAQILLQSYLESGCPESPPPPQPLDD